MWSFRSARTAERRCSIRVLSCASVAELVVAAPAVAGPADTIVAMPKPQMSALISVLLLTSSKETATAKPDAARPIKNRHQLVRRHRKCRTWCQYHLQYAHADLAHLRRPTKTKRLAEDKLITGG